jgi:microcin C transport system permease protein
MSADPASVEPTPDAPSAPPKSESVLRRRFRRFRSIRRGWFSFIVLFSLYGLSFFSHLLVSEKALVVKYDGELHFPAFGNFHEAKEFGQRRIGEANYRLLDRTLAEDGDPDTWVLMPIYEFGPIENLLEELDGPPPHKPSAQHWLGTDNRGRDVFSRLVYGFWYSLTFGLGVVGISYLLGVAVGSVFGFFGGRVDIYGQRLVEIWASLPFLYTVMIISNILQPSLGLLVFLVAIFSWVGISFYMRGEFYREKARDYVSAAIAQGESRTSIMFSHILDHQLRALRPRRGDELDRGPRLPRARSPRAHPELGRADVPGPRLPHRGGLPPRRQPDRCPPPDAPHGRLHRRGDPGGVRPQGLLEVEVTHGR